MSRFPHSLINRKYFRLSPMQSPAPPEPVFPVSGLPSREHRNKKQTGAITGKPPVLTIRIRQCPFLPDLLTEPK